MKLLICGGNVIDPVKRTVSSFDILIENGVVAACGENLSVTAPDGGETIQVLDAGGLMIAPGLFDMHCHLREPGFEYKEDLESGTKAAAKGGFTSVACMPNTKPVTDNEDVLKELMERICRKAIVHVYPIAAVTKGSGGCELTDIPNLAAQGAVALSDDGRPVSDAGVMRLALQHAKDCGIPVTSHCEELSLSAGGVMNEGAVSKRLGVPGIPGSAEEVMTARDIVLALETGAPLHIAHVSTKTSVALVRFAKARGGNVTCETCPHYFSLTDGLVETLGGGAKVSPPLRTKADRMAVIEGLIDGTIDAIATDHAPHAESEKADLMTASPGFSGFETALAAAVTVLGDHMTLPDIIKKMTINPARILKKDAGVIKEGKAADLVIFDPAEEWTVRREDFVSKGKNTPLDGKTLRGKVRYTILGGNVIYRDGKFINK